nr:apolipoprotein N-acyltransferase [Persephonella atlantica]
MAGFLISLSFPNFFIPFVYIGGFFILLYAVYKAISLKESILYSLLTGFSFTVFSFYWIVFAISHYGDVNLLVSVLLFALFGISFSLFQFVPFGIFLHITKKHRYSIFLAPFVWVILEFLREHFPFSGFPWNLMGYTLSYINPVAQITSITGIYGLSFLAVFFAVSFFILFHRKNLIPAVACIALFTGIYLWGNHRINSYTDTGTARNIAVIQGNIKEDVKLDNNKRLEVINKYLHLIQTASKYSVDLIILPESAIPVYPLYQEEDVYRLYFFDRLKKYKKPVLSGFDNVYYKNGRLILHNSVFLYDENNRLVDTYNKMKLVPFGEYVPFPFGIFRSLFPYLEGYDFVPGKEKKVIRFKEFKIVPLICFEAIFPDFVSEFAKKGNLIVNVTNDAWFGRTSAPLQHFEMARVRAVETGKYLIRAANTGISAVINPVGEIKSSLKLFEDGIILEKVYLNSKATFWAEHHYKIKLLFIILFIILSVFILRKEERNENNNTRGGGHTGKSDEKRFR